MNGSRIFSRKRIWILSTLLVVCFFTAWAQRRWLARIPNGRAEACLAAHDDIRAMTWLGWSQWLSDRNGETEFLLARSYRHQGRLVDARNHLQRAWALGWPTDILQREQWLGLAQAGQMREAEPYLPQLLEDARDDGPEISEAFVIGYLKTRQFNSANVLINAWIQDHPVAPQPHYWRALIEQESDHPDAAERALRWCLELDPHHYRAALLLAEVLYEDKKQVDEALQLYQLAKADSNQLSDASVGIARCLRAQGKREDAERELMTTLGKLHDHKDLVLELANLMIERGDYNAAVQRLQPLLVMHAKDKDFRYAYGVALRGIGRQAEAKPHLIYAAQASKDLSRIRQLIFRANQELGNVEVRYEIGSGMLKYGTVKEGLIWLESALQIDANHKPTHQLLAEHYQERASEGQEFKKLASHHRRIAESTP